MKRDRSADREPDIELHPVSEAERHIVENMYPLFIHDQWAYSETLPNEHGIIASARGAQGQGARTLAEQSEMLAPYWEGSEARTAVLVRVEKGPAGFGLLQSAPLAPEGRDHYFDEIFLLHPYRGRGVGRRVVGELCGTRPGEWCVDMKARNRPAYAFWRRVIPRQASGEVEEVTFDGEFGPVIRLRFQVGGR